MRASVHLRLWPEQLTTVHSLTDKPYTSTVTYISALITLINRYY